MSKAKISDGSNLSRFNSSFTLFVLLNLLVFSALLQVQHHPSKGFPGNPNSWIFVGLYAFYGDSNTLHDMIHCCRLPYHDISSFLEQGLQLWFLGPKWPHLVNLRIYRIHSLVLISTYRISNLKTLWYASVLPTNIYCSRAIQICRD